MAAIKRLSELPRLLGFRPIRTGEEAPSLSLTAEEGTWIKLKDFHGHLNVVLVFFRSLLDDSTDDYLRSLQRERTRFEALDTVIFGVSRYRTDRLRDYRSRHGLEFHLLYDPLALTSRDFGCSGHLRLYARPSVVVVGKNGKVIQSVRSWEPVSDLLHRLATLEGRPVPQEEAGRAFTGVRNPGAPKDDVREITSSEAQRMLDERDSPFKLLDIRTAEEFARFHPPGAVNIPLDELPHRYQELGQTTYLICLSQKGGLASAAAEFLTSVGASNVYTVADGMDVWPGAPED